jgi:hypothetical protein
MAQVLAERPAVDFFEVHPENYVLDEVALGKLEAIRGHYPLSLHGVGLSLGTVHGIDREHLKRLCALVDRLEPFLVSDHLSWSGVDGVYLNDLLPLPYTQETLEVLARNILRAQDALKRPLLIENPSAYLKFNGNALPETDFLRALVARTSCRLLLDVNNVIVSAHNLGFDAAAYLSAVPYDAVDEIHLAGHVRKEVKGHSVCIDDHASTVSEPVWDLYAQAIAMAPAAPTLIEWDADIPPLEILLAERQKARRIARKAASLPKDHALHALQAELTKLLIDGDGDESRLDISGHLSVYRNNVQTSLTTALETVFPAVRSLVGEATFLQIARRFIETNPPRAPYVAGYGAELPQFLESLEWFAAVPYVGDVAMLEWVASRVSLRAPLPPLAATRLRESAKDGAAHLRFECQGALAYLFSPYPIDSIWAFAQANGAGKPPSLDEGPVFLEISSGAQGLILRRLEEAQFRFRETLHAGATLATAAERGIAADPFFDLPAALRFALQDGIFTGCSVLQSSAEERQPCPC